MGNYDTLTELRDSMLPSLTGQSVIVADEFWMSGLRASHAPTLAGLRMVDLPADMELPDHVVSGARVLVLEIDPASDASLRRLARLRTAWPDLRIIAALRNSDVSLARTLIRQGVSDVAELPFSLHDLPGQILEMLSRQAEHAPASLAPLITVLPATGGCGATTVLTHLAMAITEKQGARLCLVDLDLQGGDVAAYLGATASVTVAELLEAGERLDDALLHSAIISTRNRFDIIAAPDTITPLDKLDLDQLLRILRLLRTSYDYVLIDMPPASTDWSLSLILAASHVYILTDTSLSSLRHAKRRLQLLSSVGLPKSDVSILVNRTERRLFRSIGTDEISDALDCPVDASLAAEGWEIRAAQDQGLLLFETQGRSRFATDVRALADRIIHSGGRG